MLDMNLDWENIKNGKIWFNSHESDRRDIVLVDVKNRYSKTCVKRPLKKKTKQKILMAHCSLWRSKVLQNAPYAILQCFWPALSDNWSWNPIIAFIEWPFYTSFTEYSLVTAANLHYEHLGSCGQIICKQRYVGFGTFLESYPQTIYYVTSIM